jgi:hypothetical protein
VPGRIGTHSSASATALAVIRGSMHTRCAPWSRALRRKNSVFVPSRISLGFQPHIRMYFEFSQSWRWLPVTSVPYTVIVAVAMHAQE